MDKLAFVSYVCHLNVSSMFSAIILAVIYTFCAQNLFGSITFFNDDSSLNSSGQVALNVRTSKTSMRVLNTCGIQNLSGTRREDGRRGLPSSGGTRDMSAGGLLCCTKHCKKLTITTSLPISPGFFSVSIASCQYHHTFHLCSPRLAATHMATATTRWDV